MSDKDVTVEPELVQKLDPLKHIKLQHGPDSYEVMDAPAGWMRDRAVLVYGQNFEHVHDDADGVWCYRKM